MPDLRRIPSIDQLLQRPVVRALEREYGHAATLDALRLEAAAFRARLARSTAFPSTEPDAVTTIEEAAGSRLRSWLAPSLRPVINATGVVIHTNLGRAPLAASAASRAAQLASGYANLEYDLSAGRRGLRDVHAEGLLTRLTGADAAVVVNNNAAATLLVLADLAAGREVVVSRGELVEIGGGFRVPEVMTQSGTILREVGTTNKTRAADYAAAIGERTALILRVHPSNFSMEGFTARPSLPELVNVAQRLTVPLFEDLGSGNLLDILPDEPTVQSSIQAGADIVCFSGDKLLGGPQAGIIVGRHGLIETIRRHPLMRALRVDKLTYAALEATLLEYVLGRAAETVPIARAISASPDDIRARASALMANLQSSTGVTLQMIDGSSMIGGGSAPGTQLPTALLALSVQGVTAVDIESRLRAGDPPVVARIQDDRVVLDLRTVLPDEGDRLAEALRQVATPH